MTDLKVAIVSDVIAFPIVSRALLIVQCYNVYCYYFILLFAAYLQQKLETCFYHFHNSTCTG